MYSSRARYFSLFFSFLLSSDTLLPKIFNIGMKTPLSLIWLPYRHTVDILFKQQTLYFISFSEPFLFFFVCVLFQNAEILMHTVLDKSSPTDYFLHLLDCYLSQAHQFLFSVTISLVLSINNFAFKIVMSNVGLQEEQDKICKMKSVLTEVHSYKQHQSCTSRANIRKRNALFNIFHTVLFHFIDYMISRCSWCKGEKQMAKHVFLGIKISYLALVKIF